MITGPPSGTQARVLRVSYRTDAPARHDVAGYSSMVSTMPIRAVISFDAGSDIRQFQAVEEFSRLADEWHRDTDMNSLIVDSLAHPAYHRIIALGQPVIPLILKDLDGKGGYWYRALESILGYSPVRAERGDNLRRLKDKWLAWGHRQGYVP